MFFLPKASHHCQTVGNSNITATPIRSSWASSNTSLGCSVPVYVCCSCSHLSWWEAHVERWQWAHSPRPVSSPLLRTAGRCRSRWAPRTRGLLREITKYMSEKKFMPIADHVACNTESVPTQIFRVGFSGLSLEVKWDQSIKVIQPEWDVRLGLNIQKRTKTHWCRAASVRKQRRVLILSWYQGNGVTTCMATQLDKIMLVLHEKEFIFKVVTSQMETLLLSSSTSSSSSSSSSSAAEAASLSWSSSSSSSTFIYPG